MSKQTDFIEAVAPGAQTGQSVYGVLASVTIAQAILESGWGESGLTKASNNLFGIKAGSGWNGRTIEYPTKEYINGQYVSTTGVFRAYDSMADSVEDHGAFLAHLARYENVIGCMDYHDATQALQEAGYATAPNYAEILCQLIEQYNLTQYDRKLWTFSCVVSAGDLADFEDMAAEKQLKHVNKEVFTGEY